MKTASLVRSGFSAAILVFMLAAGQNLSAQVRVTKVTGPETLNGKNGIVYNLHRTAVHAELQVTRTQQYAGPLAQYAKDYLGIDNVIAKDAVSYSLESASIQTSTGPDPGQVFIIEKEEKSPAEIWISFDKESPVLALERFDKNVTPEGFVNWRQDLFGKPDPALLFKEYSESPTREVFDTVVRKVSIDTVVIEQMIFKRSRVEFTDEEKAQEAAAEIKQIEHDKYNLMIGYQETAYSLETLKFMIDQLEQQRQEYLRLFTGVSVNETLMYDFPVIPDAANEKGEYVLAGFSKTTGLVEPEGQNVVTLIVKPDGAAVLPASADDPPVAGLVYRVPRDVQAIITFQGKELASARVPVLQLSPLLTLPSAFKRIEFNMETGEVKSVILE